MSLNGSRYPGVPTTFVETWVPPSPGKTLDRPKSASLAWKFSSNKMFVDFTSRWIIGGLQPLCKYSNPGQLKPNFRNNSSVGRERERERERWNMYLLTLCWVHRYSESSFPTQETCIFICIHDINHVVMTHERKVAELRWIL